MGEFNWNFINTHNDAYSLMAKTMCEKVRDLYNSGGNISRPADHGGMEIVSRQAVYSSIFKLFHRSGGYAAVTGNDDRWRRRVKRVCDRLFSGEIDEAWIPLTYNQDCIDGARQILNTLEQAIIGSGTDLSFEKRLSLPLMKKRLEESNVVATNADNGHHQNETILHFKLVGRYALSLPVEYTAMTYAGLGQTSDNATLRNVLNNFLARYNVNSMVECIKESIDLGNRPEDSRSEKLFADEIKDVLRKTVKYSNMDSAELQNALFNTGAYGVIQSVKDQTIKDLLIHYRYFEQVV